jgi:hypothetical protein
MPTMICFTLATGVSAGAGAAAAASACGVRALARMKPMPEMNRAALTRNSQCTVRMCCGC